MALIKIIPLCLVVILSVILSKLNKNVIPEQDKCPYCYGTDYCDALLLSKTSLRVDSFSMIFNNYVSSKNVFFTTDNVVLKRLGHQEAFDEFDNGLYENYDAVRVNGIDYEKEIIDLLGKQRDDVNNFKVCSGAHKFLKYLLRYKATHMRAEDYYIQLWTTIKINVEPIILQILQSKDDWPVPRYFGACGRVIAEEYCGLSLNYFENHKWIDRAYLALQLLQAATNFTDRHKHYRFYLTDISPDNVAVGDELKVKFIDLENVIVTDKRHGTQRHHSQLFENEDYSFSESDLCNSSISDHNYFSVCKLLLSKRAPWPMMPNGLLHTIPDDVQLNYPELAQLIEECVAPIDSVTRFDISDTIVKLLQTILEVYSYFG